MGTIGWLVTLVVLVLLLSATTTSKAQSVPGENSLVPTTSPDQSSAESPSQAPTVSSEPDPLPPNPPDDEAEPGDELESPSMPVPPQEAPLETPVHTTSPTTPGEPAPASSAVAVGVGVTMGVIFLVGLVVVIHCVYQRTRRSVLSSNGSIDFVV